MKTNVGTVDRLIRLMLASIAWYLGLFLYSGTAVGIVLAVAGGVLMVTAIVGFCGLYQMLGICTNSPKTQL